MDGGPRESGAEWTNLGAIPIAYHCIYSHGSALTLQRNHESWVWREWDRWVNCRVKTTEIWCRWDIDSVSECLPYSWTKHQNQIEREGRASALLYVRQWALCLIATLEKPFEVGPSHVHYSMMLQVRFTCVTFNARNSYTFLCACFFQ